MACGPAAILGLCFSRDNGKKHIGKESQKNLWYLSLGTNGQWGCSVILWDGLSICASVFFENSMGREWGHRPQDWCEISPVHASLKPWPPQAHIITSEPTFWGWPQATAPPNASPAPPLLRILWKWGQRGEETRMNKGPPWPVKIVFHVIIPFHVPLTAPSSWSLSAYSANTHDPKPQSVPSPCPACVLSASEKRRAL